MCIRDRFISNRIGHAFIIDRHRCMIQTQPFNREITEERIQDRLHIDTAVCRLYRLHIFLIEGRNQHITQIQMCIRDSNFTLYKTKDAKI